MNLDEPIKQLNLLAQRIMTALIVFFLGDGLPVNPTLAERLLGAKHCLKGHNELHPLHCCLLCKECNKC